MPYMIVLSWNCITYVCFAYLRAPARHDPLAQKRWTVTGSLLASSGMPNVCFTRSQTLVKPTVAKAFLSSMQNLNTTLRGTTCNFVRCIKPNAEMQCGVFDSR